MKKRTKAAVEALNIPQEVLCLLNKYQLNVELFNKFCIIEKITQSELLDVDYIEDRINIWKELY